MMCLREGVKFMKKANILVLIMIVSMSIVISLNVVSAEEQVVFLDNVFEEKVRAFLQVPSGIITPEQCLQVTSLNLSNLSIPFDEWETYPDSKKIHSLEDLKYFPNLVSLDIALNAVEDLTPLSNLHELTYLEAPHNKISDLSPIESLSKLEHAVFWSNQISDLNPVKGLTKLRVFSVFSNRVKDLSPLSGLISLTTLEIHDNPVNSYSPIIHLYNNLLEKDFSLDDKININLDNAESFPIDYSINDFTPIGSFGGLTCAVSFSDQYAYVGKGSSVIVLDKSDGSLKQVGKQLSLNSFISSIVSDNDILYVSAGNAGVYIVDISNDLEPVILSQYQIDGFAESITIRENILYIAAGNQGLLTLDVTDPRNPKSEGQAFAGNYVVNVTLSDNYAVLSAADDGILLADISNPESLHELSTLDTPGVVRSVLIDGNRLFIADDWKGICVADISDVTNPIIITQLDTAGHAFGLAKDNSILYVADAYMGLRIIDIEDIYSPKDITSFSPASSQMISVTLDNSLLYCVDRINGLFCLNVDNPFSPKLISLYACSIPLPLNVPSEVQDWEYKADIMRLLVLGVIRDEPLRLESNITRAEFASMLYRVKKLDGLQTSSSITLMDVPVNHVAYKAIQNAVQLGLFILPSPDSFNPDGAMTYSEIVFSLLRLVNRIPVEYSTDLCIEMAKKLGLESVYSANQDQEYVQRANAMVMLYKTIMEIPDSITNKTLFFDSFGLRLEAFPYNIYNIQVVDGYAYVLAGSDGFCVIDVRDPSNPHQIAHIDIPESVTIKVKDAYAYVFGDDGVYVIDISDPYHPYRLSSESFFVGGPIRGVVVEGNKVYAADEWGLKIFSIEDPSKCKLVSFTELWTDEFGFNSCTSDIAVRDNIAYLAFENRGLEMYNINDPEQIEYIGSFGASEYSVGNIQLVNDIAVIHFGNYVKFLDISNPNEPEERSTIILDTISSQFNYSMGTFGNIIIIPNDQQGLQLYNISDVMHPIKIGNINTPGIPSRVEVCDGTAYITDSIGGVFMLSLLNSASSESTNENEAWEFDTSWYQSASIEQYALSSEKAVKRIESLREKSDFAETLIVNTIASTGEGSLDWCLENIHEGGRILFDVSVFPPEQPATIFASNGYEIFRVGNITIDASNAGVIIDGTNVPHDQAGLHIMSSGNVVRGLQIQNFHSYALMIHRNGGNIIGGSREIGAAQIGEGNIFISSAGVTLHGEVVTDNIFVGNNVGMKADGVTPAGNKDGISLRRYTTRNVIGVDRPEYRNLISANRQNGVSSMESAYGNLIEGNLVGTDITGNHPFGNGNHGITFELCGFGSIVKNNISCANGRVGVLVGDAMSNNNVIVGNRLGIGADGETRMQNLMQEFAIYGGMRGPNFYNIFGGNSKEMKNITSSELEYEESVWAGVYDIILDGRICKYRCNDEY